MYVEVLHSLFFIYFLGFVGGKRPVSTVIGKCESSSFFIIRCYLQFLRVNLKLPLFKISFILS